MKMEEDEAAEMHHGADGEFLSWKPPEGFFELVRADWEANAVSPKGRLVMVLFRLASWFRRTNGFTHFIGVPYLVFYRITVEWVLGVEIPPLTRVGPGLAVHHGQGIVINNRSILGSHCVIRQGVTLGNRSSEDRFGCPVLHDRVTVAANAIILGRIEVGEDAVIGAGAVVLKDVPARAVVVGNPARVIRVKPGGDDSDK